MSITEKGKIPLDQDADTLEGGAPPKEQGHHGKLGLLKRNEDAPGREARRSNRRTGSALLNHLGARATDVARFAPLVAAVLAPLSTLLE